jgi:hypothetical protein
MYPIYKVNLKIMGNDLNIESCDVIGKPFLNGDKWVFNVFDIEGDIKDRYESENKDEVCDMYDRSVKLLDKKMKDEENKKLDEETTFLQDVVDGQSKSMNKIDMFDEDDAETIKQKEEHKDEFDRNEEACKNEATNILMQLAKIYLSTDMINENDYIKFKLQLEQKSLSSLIFQLDVARKAIFKLSETIHLGNATSKHYEALTQLNRVVLDISKYQNEYLSNIGKSIKEIECDITLSKEKGALSDKRNSEDVEFEEVDGDDEIMVTTNDRKKLIQIINEMKDESLFDTDSAVVSKNPKLINKDEIVPDENSLHDDEKYLLGANKDSNSETGLETY